ncbi:MAG: hypothetical protein H6713_18170 [Myxococcales bacterium]|nr:hypothetical protein [Myxococcales bacterium]
MRVGAWASSGWIEGWIEGGIEGWIERRVGAWAGRLALASTLLGCGDSGDDSGGSSDASSASASAASLSASGLVTGDSMHASDGGGSDSSASGSGSTSGASEGATSEDSGVSESSADGPKFDLETPDTPSVDPCGGEPGDPPFSYIWIANSTQGTVSKLNTFTGVEEGRYAVGPGATDPSRTSVNLLGDVAVVDRNGGIAKIAAREEDCVDSNNNGQIDTSHDASYLPWGQDECVLWHLPLASSGNRGPRPVAWVGEYDAETCTGSSPYVWVGHYHQTLNKGMFFRLDGQSGSIDAAVEHAPWSGNNWGPYGGAVNAAGDFWVLGWQTGPLIRVDYDTLQVDAHETPHLAGEWTYGITVDGNGHPWIASAGYVHHFNPDTQQWTNIAASGSYRGLMADASGNVWAARNGPCGVAHLDVATKSLIGYVENFGCVTPVGISIDIEGFVWVVDQSTQSAFKVDPDSYQVALQVTGLVQPYTYSDMTGAGLNLVVNPPG